MRNRHIISLCFSFGFLFWSTVSQSQNMKNEPFQKVQNEPYERGASETNVFFGGTFKPEMFGAKNSTFLNNANNFDRIGYLRSTLDLSARAKTEFLLYDDPCMEFYFAVRTKGVWGKPSSVARTSEAEIRLRDTLLGVHKHTLPRNVFWLREGWMSIDFNQVWDMNWAPYLKMGAFPFKLGYGISLGSAYAVGSSLLGFYSDSSIDQYAFGVGLNGILFNDDLSYNIYFGLLDNKSSSVSDTAAKTRGQEYGRRDCPERGHGKVNYVFATRLLYDVFGDEALIVQPYCLYNEDPEQKIEFRGDASSKLGTIGISCAFKKESFDWGFDIARNVGSQRLPGWDRNHIQLQSRNGVPVFVNSHVFMSADSTQSLSDGARFSDFKVPHAPSIITENGASSAGSEVQNAINMSRQAGVENGKPLGHIASSEFVDNVTAIVAPDGEQTGVVEGELYNAINRFRDPYTNKYDGWMAVADAGYWLYEKQLQVAVTVGYASGDADPNRDILDRRFSGFIPLQEIYSGRLVKSAFLLGSAGRVSRPLSAPRSDQVPNRFARALNGFTNIRFVGTALLWNPSDVKLHANLLAYWQDFPSKKFDARTRQELDTCADTFLGVEINLFGQYQWLENVNIFMITSFFFPGKFFDDIKGKPLDTDQNEALDRLDRTGFVETNIPNIGSDRAMTFNIGLEYSF